MNHERKEYSRIMNPIVWTKIFRRVVSQVGTRLYGRVCGVELIRYYEPKFPEHMFNKT